MKISSEKYYILNMNKGKRIEAECTNEEQGTKLLQNINIYKNNINIYILTKGKYIQEYYQKKKNKKRHIN